MHMPDRWGFLYLSDKVIGTGTDSFKYPYNMAAYKLLWAMFYAQLDNYAKEKNYIRSKENFFLTEAELKDLPAGAEISVEATQRTFCMSVSVPEEKYVMWWTITVGLLVKLLLPVR